MLRQKLRSQQVIRRFGLWVLGANLFLFLGFFFWTRSQAKLVHPEPSYFLEDRTGQFLSESNEERLGFWPIDAVPPRLEACLLAAEDRRFYQHGGIDSRSLLRALWNNLRGNPRQGASTLAMQVARLQDPGPRTYPKKAVEMAIAWHLVHKFGHQKVLQHYVRIMPQGRRIHGAAYASRRYFQKPLSDISWAEASLLAALPRAPGRMNLHRPDGLSAAKSRANLILTLLKKEQLLSLEAYAAAVLQLAELQLPAPEIRPFNALHAIHRIQESLNGFSQFDRTRPVRTTLDLRLQDLVDQWSSQTLEAWRGRGAGNIAAMVVERKTGQILSYIGSDWYDDTDQAGSINYARTPRSSGSTLKPFLYAYGLETGAFAPNSVLPDLPLLMVDSSGHYGVSNFDDSYLGPLLLRSALANSRNIPAVRLLREVGIDTTYAFLQELGLATSQTPASFYGLGMAIGGVYVTLEDLVRAYTCLANEGMDRPLSWFPADETPISKRLISEANARQLALFLSDPLARQPTFPRGSALEYPFPVAVKTGTSQGFRDAWCMAFSSDYVVGVWLGRPDHQPMNRISGLAAAELVKKILLHLHPDAAEGVGIQPFPPPRNMQATKLCPLSGLLASADCDQVMFEYLSPIERPHEFTQVHQRFAVDKVTGHQAGPTTPTSHVQIRKALVLPGAYAVWASRRGEGPPLPPQVRVNQVKLAIQIPVNGSRLHLDPTSPPIFQTLPLRATIEPMVPEVEWWVDDVLFQTVRFPYETRWPLQRGTHKFQLRLPRAMIQSDIVSVSVRSGSDP